MSENNAADTKNNVSDMYMEKEDVIEINTTKNLNDNVVEGIKNGIDNKNNTNLKSEILELFLTSQVFKPVSLLKEKDVMSIGGSNKRSFSKMVFGTGYIAPNITNKSQPDKVSNETEEIMKDENWKYDNDKRKIVYNDLAVMLSKEFLMGVDYNNLPLLIEHCNGCVVGNVLSGSFLPNERELKITAVVTEPKLRDMINSSEIETIASFSIGYSCKILDGIVFDKKVNEFSLVSEPFFEGCDIEVFASKESSVEKHKNENGNNEKLYSKICKKKKESLPDIVRVTHLLFYYIIK